MKYLFFSTGRSGHHAIVNWIGNQYKSSFIHKVNYFKGWENKKLEKYSDAYFDSCFGDQKDEDASILYSFENFTQSDYYEFDFESFNQLTKPVTKIISLRDPYNWLASSFKIKGESQQAAKYLKSPWIDPAGRKRDSLISIYKKLATRKDILNPHIFINYNEWIKSKDYRNNLRLELNLNDSIKGTGKVSKRGGGSSFGNTKNLSKRYEIYLADKKNFYIIT